MISQELVPSLPLEWQVFGPTRARTADRGNSNNRNKMSALTAAALVAGVMAASAPAHSQTSNFCATQSDPSVLLCDDFFNVPNGPPPAEYLVVTPRGGTQSAMNVSVANEELLMAYAGGFGVAAASRVETFQIDGTSNLALEGDVKFGAYARSAAGIEWSEAPNPADQIQFFLQRDEQRAYIGVWISDLSDPGNSVAYYTSKVFPINSSQTYRLRVEVLGHERIRAYVDGQMIFDLGAAELGGDLSGLTGLDLNPAFVANSHGSSPWQVLFFDNLLVRDLPKLACVGFEPPMAGGPVTVKKDRALPLKIELHNDLGMSIADWDIPAPPVIQIVYTPSAGAAQDVTHDSIAVGHGTEGNHFEFTGSRWQYNLRTDGFSGVGTYTITVVPGGDYFVDPTCTASFVKNN